MLLRTNSVLIFSTVIFVAACGDNPESTETGGGTTTTTTTTGLGGGTTSTSSTTTSEGGAGGGGTGGVGGTGGTGGSAPFVPPTPFAVPLSAEGPDQLQSVTTAADGDFVAAGFSAAIVGGTRTVTVVKFSASGPDPVFGTGGVASTPLTFVGGSDEIDIATQSDGKIIVSATVANAQNANDRDVAVTRLLPNGALDVAFGTQGILVLNLNDAHDDGMMLVGLDASRSLAVDTDNNIFLHAASRALGTATGGGPRLDTDFVVVKMAPNGTLDTSFGTNGDFRLDIAEVNATPRGLRALPDGSLLVSGYASTPDEGDTPQPVLFK